MCLICLKFEIQYFLFFYKTAGKMHFYICYVPKRRLYITYSLKSFTVSKHGNKIYYIYKEKVNVFFSSE